MRTLLPQKRNLVQLYTKITRLSTIAFRQSVILDGSMMNDAKNLELIDNSNKAVMCTNFYV